MSDASAPPPAGWYADPENAAGERWWNGSSWSDHKRAAAPATPTIAPVAPAAAATGFTYGSTAPGARPDPYAPMPVGGAPVAGSPYVAPLPYGAASAVPGVNGLALAGLLVGAIGWLIVPVLASAAGIVLSAIGLSHAKNREATGHPKPGRGLAIAGLVVSIAILSLTILGYVAVFASLMSS